MVTIDTENVSSDWSTYIADLSNACLGKVATESGEQWHLSSLSVYLRILCRSVFSFAGYIIIRTYYNNKNQSRKAILIKQSSVLE